ncbi:MAG: dTDP-glucose 4,6-dehydratase [Planctomycetota bacterium]
MHDLGFRPQRIFITGGCGFIGSNLVRFLLAQDAALQVTNFDLLTYAGNPANLADLPLDAKARYRFIQGDLRDAGALQTALTQARPEAVIHLAAESHVDRSIGGPEAFVTTNVLGTQHLLEALRALWTDRRGKRFQHVSTDEVYGSLGPTGRFTEHSPYNPSSPYAATKAAADHLVRAYHHTYGLPVVLTNASNNYGPRQFPEKLIPLLITRGLTGGALPIYGEGKNVRDWLHVDDHCAALWAVLTRGGVGETYNIGGGCELPNIEIAQLIAELIDASGWNTPVGAKTADRIEFVADRPGHDFRYALDCGKIHRELAWHPQFDFRAGLTATVAWYAAHRTWWEPLVSVPRRQGPS